LHLGGEGHISLVYVHALHAAALEALLLAHASLMDELKQGCRVDAIIVQATNRARGNVQHQISLLGHEVIGEKHEGH
jgi:hypothetical protein